MQIKQTDNIHYQWLRMDRFGHTFLSMVISVIVYKFVFSWVLAIGLVLMMFIHEMGHVWAARERNVAITAPAFIPLIGAVMTFRKLPENAQTEAFIAYGGPLLGSIGATVIYMIGLLTNVQEFILIAMVGFVLNLFNLIPLAPLDGGRIVTAISRWFWALGFLLALYFMYWTQTYLLTVVLMFFMWEFRYMTKKDNQKRWEWRARIKVPKDRLAKNLSVEQLKSCELNWRQYSTLQEKAVVTEIEHPSIGVIKKMYEGQFFGRIQEIRWRKVKEKKKHYIFSFQVFFDRDAFRNKTYYQVPRQTRLAFGGAYMGLVLFLVSMIYFNRYVFQYGW